MSKRNTRTPRANRNARIVTANRPNTLYARQTWTAGRDEGTLQAVAATESDGTTAFVLARSGVQLELNGHEARTLFNVLAKHYYA